MSLRPRGSTNKQYLCSRQHEEAMFLLPGSTNKQCLCPRASEHECCLFVLPGAHLEHQHSSEASREHKCCLFVCWRRCWLIASADACSLLAYTDAHC